MSRADWKRSPGFFSRQCRTMRCSAGDGPEPLVAISGGSSFRIAAMLSAAVSRPNACRPVSISYSTAPKEKMSERWSTASPRTCSGDM